MQAASFRPAANVQVADIFVDFAPGLGDGQRQVGDESVEEVQKALLPEPRMEGRTTMRLTCASCSAKLASILPRT